VPEIDAFSGLCALRVTAGNKMRRAGKKGSVTGFVSGWVLLNERAHESDVHPWSVL
jgi:hypothetical protein